jgi:hypothetical protein
MRDRDRVEREQRSRRDQRGKIAAVREAGQHAATLPAR